MTLNNGVDLPALGLGVFQTPPEETRVAVETALTKPSRIAENINVFDFELSADEITAIDGLDTGHRGGPEPDAITLETFGREIPEA